jgi:hypothetical protein
LFESLEWCLVNPRDPFDRGPRYPLLQEVLNDSDLSSDLAFFQELLSMRHQLISQLRRPAKAALKDSFLPAVRRRLPHVCRAVIVSKIGVPVYGYLWP